MALLLCSHREKALSNIKQIVYNKICMGISSLLMRGTENAWESQGTDMNCKEAEKTIPSFLNDELDGDDLAEFVEHIEGCPECKEELSIQFLVAEGLEQLEQGNNFNLQEALVETLDSADDRIRINRFLRRVLFGLELAVAAAIVAAVVIVSM